MFHGIKFKSATLGQFLEIFILICLNSHSRVIFEELLSAVHEVPASPPCALNPLSVLLQQEPVKRQAGSSGYFIRPHHLCKKTDEINERLPVVFSAPTYHSLGDICLGSCCSATSAYSVSVEFLLCSVRASKIEMLLFTVRDVFQMPVHDALIYFKVITLLFTKHILCPLG